jgi:hypothetical protein
LSLGAGLSSVEAGRVGGGYLSLAATTSAAWGGPSSSALKVEAGLRPNWLLSVYAYGEASGPGVTAGVGVRLRW